VPEATTHVILTLDRIYGSVATSPQVPGLVIARSTFEALIADLNAELDRAGVGSKRELHVQEYVEGYEGRPYLIRMALDEHQDVRADIYDRLVATVEAPDFTVQRHLTEDLLGVTGLVAAVRSDRLYWLRDQMDPSGAALAPVIEAPDGAFIYRQMASTGVELNAPWFDASGILEWTLGEVVDSAATFDAEGKLLEGPKTSAMFTALDAGAVLLV
jgi:hypothetical protein